MIKNIQHIDECSYCGTLFEDGETYWRGSLGHCYCDNNACGWEDDADFEVENDND